jgi:thymidine phosphorylase
MIQLGADRGCPVVALLTAMDRPLGNACGNAIEVKESLAALRGNGPDDLMEVTYALGAEMLILAGTASNPGQAWKLMKDAISSGKALEKFREIIAAQDGDPRIIDDESLLPAAPIQDVVRSDRSGFVAEVAPRTVGHGIIAIGGGRKTMEDKVDPSVGFIMKVKPGDKISAGDELAEIHVGDEASRARATRIIRNAVRITDEPGEAPLPLVSHRVDANGTHPWKRPAT